MAYAVFRIAFFAVFTGLHAVLMAGLFLEWRRDRRAAGHVAAGPEQGLPDAAALVSVVVPFRNEERRMKTLLAGLAAQDYPKKEFIFVDDRSEDGTGALLRAFAEKEAHVSIITLKENPGPNHKQFALEKGLEKAKGTLILFTDGDCELGPGWIRAMVGRMGDSRTGAAIGPVFKKPLPAEEHFGENPAPDRVNGGSRKTGRTSFFSLYQCFDHAVRYMYLAASTGLGAAGGGFGNNLILKREVLDAIGGYGTVPVSPTEDAALISRIRAITDYRIRSICGTDAAVITAPEYSWKAFLRQTLRWNNGGLFSPDLGTRCNFSFLMVTISMGMLALPVVPLLPGLWPLPAAVLLSMSANTVATLILFGAFLPKAGPAYIFQILFTPVYFTFLTILGLLGFKPAWKTQIHEHNAA
ncbi:MAG: glycosyltransferase [Treponema sp.]|jgi:cellulose synthase/poly-beta-1,6-N-acetylglucosamine synthase-like glycosyltransferase|nr:glycosyltransferase [Treponema sp.]